MAWAMLSSRRGLLPHPVLPRAEHHQLDQAPGSEDTGAQRQHTFLVACHSRRASLGALSPFELSPLALPLFLRNLCNCCEKGFFPLDLCQLGTRRGVERVASGHGLYLNFHLD